MQGFYYLAETTKFVDNYGKDWVSRFVKDGIPTAVLGILTVFTVLALIWGCLEIFKYVFYTMPERNKKASASDAAEESVKETVVYEEAAQDDGEIVAAIVAAITAYRAEETGESGKSTGFRVVSFRKR